MPRQTSKPGLVRRLVRFAAIVAGLLALVSVGLVVPLRWIDPPTTSFMLQDESGRIPVAYQWTDWPELGTAAALAVIAAEDQKFAQHSGFDFASIQDSVMEYREGGELRGASTITQQVAKNLYLWPGRSFIRKGIEAWLALLLELSLSKQRILEIYLNIAQFGPGVYGVPAASREYFGKSPADLTDNEAALLAAVLPNPLRLQVDRPTPYLKGRQRWIVDNMERLRRQGWIALMQ